MNEERSEVETESKRRKGTLGGLKRISSFLGRICCWTSLSSSFRFGTVL